jgi:hypothetical protein
MFVPGLEGEMRIKGVRNGMELERVARKQDLGRRAYTARVSYNWAPTTHLRSVHAQPTFL